MAGVKGPYFVAFWVRDLGASGRLYEEKLGLERVSHGPSDAVASATEPTAFAVQEPLADPGAVDGLDHDDAQVLHDSYVDAGVWVVQEPFGGTFAFVETDGYREMMHNGG